jgi:hypothetical protein
MKTLQDVAKAYRKSVGEALYPGKPYNYGSGKTPQSSRAFATGNLLSSFLTDPQNQITRIGAKIRDGYQFVVNIAPDGAYYGRWVHYGTRKMRARPFGELGAVDSQFKKVLDEFMLDEVEKNLAGSMKVLEDEWKRAGFKIE